MEGISHTDILKVIKKKATVKELTNLVSLQIRDMNEPFTVKRQRTTLKRPLVRRERPKNYPLSYKCKLLYFYCPRSCQKFS